MKNGNSNLDRFNHIDLLFPSDYLKAGDLLGKDVTVIIERIEPRHPLKTARGSDAKPVMYFRGKKKGLVLNRTNGKRIAKLYGSKPSEWIGKAITLYAEEVEAFGDVVDAVRVRKRAPGANVQPDTSPEPDGEEPFDRIEAELAAQREAAQ